MKQKKYIILGAIILIALLAIISYSLFSNKKSSNQTTNPPAAISDNGRSWSVDNGNLNISGQDSAGKTTKIAVGFPVANLFVSPDSNYVIVEKQNTNNTPSMKYFSVGENKEPKEIGQNIQKFTWISNDTYVYYQKPVGAKGQLMLSGTKTPLLDGLEAPSMQIAASERYLFLSFLKNTDDESFTHLRINLSTKQSSELNIPSDKVIISSSPNGETLIVATPNASLKQVFAYTLSSGKLLELPSTPFSASIKWVDQNRFMYLKDSAEPTDPNKLNSELMPNSIALYDLIKKQETTMVVGNQEKISAFSFKDGKITYVDSNGDTKSQIVSL